MDINNENNHLQDLPCASPRAFNPVHRVIGSVSLPHSRVIPLFYFPLYARRPLDQDRMISWSGNYNKGEVS